MMEGEIERFVDLGSAKCRECGINICGVCVTSA
jgi:hypothetical protein